MTIDIRDELDMQRLAWGGYTLRVDATIVGTAPLIHDVRRSTTPAPVTPLEIAEDHLRTLPGVGPHTDIAEIVGAYLCGVEATLFPIDGEWRPELVGRVDGSGRIYEVWNPRFDEWSASGSFFIRPDYWTPGRLRERVERAGVGRFRVASWAVCDAMAGELVRA